MKSTEFHPAVKKSIQEIPKDIRLALGKAIFALQLGRKLEMPLSKPMKEVGKGVEEIRIKDSSGIYRAFYLARFEDRVLIFHFFKKKTQKTPQKEIDLGKKRLKEMIDG
ncbi:MAG: type II toxin-antitoxin system RelE/ParE family toxin [Bdellovibrionales bacterium]|nr:type II toxin-antitoxin system RelE/ParE family toxin [Bdellovibrionales bacterium]